DQPPLFVREAARLVEDRLRYARLPDVVKQGREPEVIELKLRQTEAFPERDREDADVDAVRERVLVVIADRRETDERRLLVQDLIADPLHDALVLLVVRAPADTDGRHEVACRGDRLLVRPLRA